MEVWVYDPPMTFTILSGRWVGNTGCPAKSSTEGGHPICKVYYRQHSPVKGLSTKVPAVLQKAKQAGLQYIKLPYLRVYKPHSSDKNLPSKIGVLLLHEI
jgi:hypothetical protein